MSRLLAIQQNKTTNNTNIDNVTSTVIDESTAMLVERTTEVFVEVTSKATVAALLNLELNNSDKNVLAFHERNNQQNINVTSSSHATSHLIDVLNGEKRKLDESNRQSNSSSSSSSISSGSNNYQFDNTGNIYCQPSIRSSSSSSKVIVNSIVQVDSDDEVTNAEAKRSKSGKGVADDEVTKDELKRSTSAKGMKQFAMEQAAMDLAVSKSSRNYFIMIDCCY